MVFNNCYNNDCIHISEVTEILFLEIDDFKQIAGISNNQQITFTNCDHIKGLTLTIENDAAFENDENIIITLIVILTQMVNGNDIRLNLSEEEERRLILNMTEITVIIRDDDGNLDYY